MGIISTCAWRHRAFCIKFWGVEEIGDPSSSPPMKTGCNQTMEESTSMNSTEIHDAIFQIWLKTKSSWKPPVICLVVWFFKVQTYIYWYIAMCKNCCRPFTNTQTWIILLKCLYAYEKIINLKKTFTQTHMYQYHTSNKRPWINFLKISIKSLDSYALIELSLRISNFNMIHSRCFLYSQINEFVESKRVIHVYLSSSLLM